MILEENRHTYQWNLIKSLKMNPHLYGLLVYEKEGKYTMGGKTAFSIIGTGKTGQLHAEELNWITLSHYT